MQLVSILRLSTELRSLSLKFLLRDRQRVPKDFPEIYLARLRRLTITLCPHGLANSLIRGAPNLLELAASTRHEYDLFDIGAAEIYISPRVKSLRLQILEPLHVDRPAGLLPAGGGPPLSPIEALSSFLAFFPSLTNLELWWQFPVNLTQEQRHDSLQSLDHLTLLQSIPSTVEQLALRGDLCEAAAFLVHFLDPSKTSIKKLPRMRILGVIDAAETRVTQGRNKLLAEACEVRGIRVEYGNKALWNTY